MDETFSTTQLYVGNLSTDFLTADLVKEFQTFGMLTDSFVAIRQGRHRGFGFVTFESDVAALAAQKNMHGHTVQGRAMRVMFAKERDTASSQKSDSKKMAKKMTKISKASSAPRIKNHGISKEPQFTTSTTSTTSTTVAQSVTKQSRKTNRTAKKKKLRTSTSSSTTSSTLLSMAQLGERRKMKMKKKSNISKSSSSNSSGSSGSRSSRSSSSRDRGKQDTISNNQQTNYQPTAHRSSPYAMLEDVFKGSTSVLTKNKDTQPSPIQIKVFIKKTDALVRKVLRNCTIIFRKPPPPHVIDYLKQSFLLISWKWDLEAGGDRVEKSQPPTVVQLMQWSATCQSYFSNVNVSKRQTGKKYMYLVGR